MSTPFDVFCDLCETYIGQLDDDEMEYAKEIVDSNGWYFVESSRSNDLEISYVGLMDEQELARLRAIEAAEGFEADNYVISAPNADCLYLRVEVDAAQ